MKKKVKVLIGAGIFCLVMLLASVGYAVAFNGSRLVVPMDFSEYEFTVKDLPMIVSVILVTLYVCFLVVLASTANRKKKVTRKLNPRLGFLGFLGFMGFWAAPAEKAVGSFLYFCFFGFFGFFYEGKMSDTLMDERYVENRMRAQLNAHKAAVNIIFLALLVLGGGFMGNVEFSLIAFEIIVALAIALDLFLGEFLLYRYDYDDKRCESEE